LCFFPDSKHCSDQKNGRRKIVVGVGFGVTALCLVLIVVGILWRKGYTKGIIRREKGECLGSNSLSGRIVDTNVY